jgi:hypothetical protein
MPRPALIAGPTLLLVGLLMMLVPSAWLASHLVFLAGTLLVPWTALALHDLLAGAPPWLRRSGLVLTCVGALALAGQFLIDFVVAQLAGTGDRGPLFDRVQESPVFDAVFYTAGPALMFVGLLVSGAGLVGLGRRIGWLLVAGTLVVGLSRLLGDRLVEVVGTAAVLLACVVVALPAARPAPASLVR